MALEEICGNCDEYDCDECYCPHMGEMFEADSCEGFVNKAEDLTVEEKRGIIGDLESHRIMVEGDFFD